MTPGPKTCPIPPNANANRPQFPEGPWVAAGRTQMMLGTRVNKTWNPTTKQWEWMARPGITQGATGEKVWKFGPSKLI
jgi:hypothetical protein